MSIIAHSSVLAMQVPRIPPPRRCSIQRHLYVTSAFQNDILSSCVHMMITDRLEVNYVFYEFLQN
jgi:hypothetical protein